jgi:hypothetical protein
VNRQRKSTLAGRQVTAVVMAAFMALAAFACSGSLGGEVTGRRFEQVGHWRVLEGGRPSTDFVVWVVMEDERRFVVEDLKHHGLVFLSAPRRKGLVLDASIPVQRDEKAGSLTIDLPGKSSHSFHIDVSPASIDFDFQGRALTLAVAPPMLGEVECDRVLQEFPEMKRRADAYPVDAGELQRLRAEMSQEPRHLQIVFGSWCPASRELVPRVLAVTRRLGAPLLATCVAVGQPVRTDAAAAKLGVSGVPVVIDASDPTRRVSGEALLQPETALERLWAKK